MFSSGFSPAIPVIIVASAPNAAAMLFSRCRFSACLRRDAHAAHFSLAVAESRWRDSASARQSDAPAAMPDV